MPLPQFHRRLSTSRSSQNPVNAVSRVTQLLLAPALAQEYALALALEIDPFLIIYEVQSVTAKWDERKKMVGNSTIK